MKLRNKKTGVIIDTNEWSFFCNYESISIENDEDANKDFRYGSLAELNEEWEDVEDINVTNTPLIEDEAKRSVFKAWAEILGRNLEKADFKYDAERNGFDCYLAESIIEFANGEGINCVDREIYTFRALCGEEEE